jgi:hypothetical protein
METVMRSLLALWYDSDFDVQLWAMALVPRVIHSAIDYRRAAKPSFSLGGV